MTVIQRYETKYHFDPKSDGYLGAYYPYSGLDGVNGGDFVAVTQTKTHGVLRYYDEEFRGPEKIIVDGKNLQYKNGDIVGGTVTKVTLIDSHGEKTMVIKDMDVSFNAINRLIWGNGQSALAYFTSGNDKVIGSKSNDDLYGGTGKDVIKGGAGHDLIDGYTGKDTLTGGTGNDAFVFKTGYGRDTITDFDANGGYGHQDHIHMTFEDFDKVTITQSGKDTIIALNAYDTLTLKNVDHKLITAVDFDLYIA